MSGNLPSSQSDSATNLTNSSNQAPILKVDDAIKTYLLRKGYHQAANALESEMKKSLHDSSSSSSRSSSLVLGEIPSFLLDIYSREVKEHVTFDDYKLLHEWIANSLDVVKPELLAINFPIFVHTYLLMRRQNNLEANDLLAYAGPDFIHDYTEEVNALSLFTDYEVRLSVTIFV